MKEFEEGTAVPDFVENDASGDSWKKKDYSFNILPYGINKHLEFMDISKEGHLVLSSSNLVVGDWVGSIWLFNSADVTPSPKESFTGYGCESPAACGRFLGKEKVILGEDNGRVSIVSVHYENCGKMSPFMNLDLSATQHDNNVSSLCVTDSSSSSVTSGSDLRINVWDNNTLELCHKFSPAHSVGICQVVSVFDQTSDLFASAGMDGLVLLWDPKQSRPASSIFPGNELGIKTLCWLDEHILAAGNIASDVHLIDTRSNSALETLKFQSCAMHYLATNRKGLLAACGDSKLIKVWDTSSKELVYTNQDHSGLVRGLCWNPVNSKLYSCGFDERVLPHDIPQASKE